jgi:tRNA1Val (adenine37-N6)-methyltransferase
MKPFWNFTGTISFLLQVKIFSTFRITFMSETTFHFRQFTINQDRCAMKVSTDAVLIGSWVKPDKAKCILDIGTGTGVIALMLAQKSEAQIHAIDIDKHACCQAEENFALSPWNNRLHVTHQCFQEFSKQQHDKYDLIVTNPPYFHHASKPQQESRFNARHSEALTFDELIDGVLKLLSSDGKFFVILPYREGMEFLVKAQKNSLFCHHILRVKTKADRAEKRLIMEFGFSFRILTEAEIIIQQFDGSMTNEYIELTRDYYLQLKQAPHAY